MTDKQKAIIRYHESGIEKEEQSPLERLRFFCQLAMSGDDWVDAGHFFDSLALQVRDKVDIGPWSAGTTSDGRAYLESSDFTHDVRLYVDGDFAWSGDKLNYAKGIASQLNNAPVSAEPVDHPMEEVMGYRLEFKPEEYCYYTPEGYALEAYKGDAPTHALYANPQPGCPSEIEIYKGWCWVRPKYNAGIVDETFQPLFLGPQIGGAISSQPDLTRQTLDDVKAGIPARDAEIEALRKEIAVLRGRAVPAETLRVCGVIADKIEDGSLFMAGIYRNKDLAGFVRQVLSSVSITQAQQPVSGADGLPSNTDFDGWAEDLSRLGYECNREGVEAYLRKIFSDRAALDHLPDATKMVGQDQFRDPAQMIEPSGNSGELDEDDSIALDRLADYIADTWPMDKKYSLEEICQRLHVMWPGEFIAIEDLRKNDPNLREAVRALLIHWQRFQKSDGNHQDAYNLLVKGAKMAWKFAEDELSRSESPDAQVRSLAQQDAPVDADPVRLTLGSYGKAFDLPGNRRAYTYDHQPGNVEASRLGNACQQAAAASAGDTIDRGLNLLKELQAVGFGVFDSARKEQE